MAKFVVWDVKFLPKSMNIYHFSLDNTAPQQEHSTFAQIYIW